MAIGKFISKKIKSSSDDGDFLTIGDVVTSQTYWHGFQSLTTVDQLSEFASDPNNDFNNQVFPRQSGVVISGAVSGGGNAVYELFSQGNTKSWQQFTNSGNLGTTGLASGSQMLGFPSGNETGDSDNTQYILLQGWKMFFSDLINISGSSVDWNTPSTYAGIPVYLYYSASPPIYLTVTPPSSSGDTIRCVGHIWGAYIIEGKNSAILIFFDPDGFYVQV